MLPGQSPVQKLSSKGELDLSQQGLGLDKNRPSGHGFVETIERHLSVFDQLVKAVECKTVSPEDLRDPATPELRASREKYIGDLYAKVQELFKGPKSEEMEILIRAAAQRGRGHRLILMRMCPQHLG